VRQKSSHFWQQLFLVVSFVIVSYFQSVQFDDRRTNQARRADSAAGQQDSADCLGSCRNWAEIMRITDGNIPKKHFSRLEEK